MNRGIFVHAYDGSRCFKRVEHLSRVRFTQGKIKSNFNTYAGHELNL